MVLEKYFGYVCNGIRVTPALLLAGFVKHYPDQMWLEINHSDGVLVVKLEDLA